MTQVVLDLFSNGPKRHQLLTLLTPAIFVVYFGSLAAAVHFCSGTYDWRYRSISWLLYPRNDPNFHLIASLAIAATGLLMVPFAAYIRMRLRGESIILTNLGALLLGAGCLLLILAGLIVSHPYAGNARFPRLHEALARSAALALGIGMLLLWVSAIKTWLVSSVTDGSRLRKLLIAWSLLVIPTILVLALRLLAYAARGGSSEVVRIIESRSVWHLGFWEWIGSGAVFLFLLSAALFLPDHTSNNLPCRAGPGEAIPAPAANTPRQRKT